MASKFFKFLLVVLTCVSASVEKEEQVKPQGMSSAYLDLLDPPEASYNILMLLPLSSKSHRNIFMALAHGLADRGHKIDLLVNHPPISNHSNIREVYHGLPHFNEAKFNLFEKRVNPWQIYWLLLNGLPSMTQELYQLGAVQELYQRRNSYHVVIIDNFYNQMMYPFAYGRPLVMVAAAGMDHLASAVKGNVLNPSYVPVVPVNLQPNSFMGRVLNTAVHIAAGLMRYHLILPRVQTEISSIFPDLPPLRDIERNQSLTLLNSHFSTSPSLPLLPSQIEVGALHCYPGSPLPQDLQQWVEGAGEAGVVYFSLGTVAQGSSMPTHWRRLFMEAFSKIPQRVVWKYDGDLPDVSENVFVNKWLPQQDLLAHPQVKVFITHGGMLSTMEGIYHATPLMLLPIFGDQPRNAVQASGLGITLQWEDLSVELIINTLNTLVNDSRYQAKIKEVSTQLRDQPEPPLNRAVFWTEYVIRHQGAPQLRSPAEEVSWVDYLMLDVVLMLQLALYVIYRVIYGLLKQIFKCQFRSSVKRKTD